MTSHINKKFQSILKRDLNIVAVQCSDVCIFQILDFVYTMFYKMALDWSVIYANPVFLGGLFPNSK